MADDNSRPVADNFARRFAPPELFDPKKRREWKLGRHDKDRGPYVIELNLQHIEGLSGAVAALNRLLTELPHDPSQRPPEADYITKTYGHVMLTVAEWQSLLQNDEKQAEALAREAAAQQTSLQAGGRLIDTIRYRAIYKLWPDFPVFSQIYRSVATIKSDAAVRSSGAGGSGIVWAVIDSGIDGDHPHFNTESGLTLRSSKSRTCIVVSSTARDRRGLDIPFVESAPRDPDACHNQLRAHRRSIRHIATIAPSSSMPIVAWR